VERFNKTVAPRTAWLYKQTLDPNTPHPSLQQLARIARDEGYQLERKEESYAIPTSVKQIL